MNEVEIWGVLSEKEFDSKLNEFTEKFGAPKIQKRLAIQILDADDRSLWTRIRITDGKAEIMQKLGSWDIGSQQEVSFPIETKERYIWNCYTIIRNLLRSRRIQIVFIQHKNFIFETNGFEIKLSHQFGKSDKYPFEVEAQESEETIIEFARNLGLEPDLSKKGETFWNKWNDAVNLDGKKMKDEELKEIIRKYVRGN